MNFKRHTKPHDYFFKLSMRMVRLVRDFLITFIDPAIVKNVNLSSFEISKESWVDIEFSEHFADVVYHAQLKRSNGSMYFLFEHKSGIDKYVSVQNLYYMSLILDQIKEQKRRTSKLPLILPIIVYNGVKLWNVSNSIKPLFEIPDGADKYLPDYQSAVIDLKTVNESKITKSRILKAFIIALKYGKSKEILQRLPEIIWLFEKAKKADMAYLSSIIIYIGSVIPEIDQKKCLRILRQECYKGAVFMNDIFNLLRKEGFIIGIKKGREEGEKKGIIKGEKIGISKGEKIGAAKGEKIGVAKGEKIGIRKGKQEGVNEGKVLVAKKMLFDKKSTREIHKLTGIPVNQIEMKLKKTSRTGARKKIS